jgi:CcmD family protein
VSAWGFVFLAYGIVWLALLLYLFSLKRRAHRVEAELSSLRPAGELKQNAED